MKERPILFSGSMVRALLDGTKTQTRRVVKARPGWPISFVGGAGDQDDPSCYGFEDLNSGQWWTLAPDGRVDNNQIPSPYGAPGDRLWVRESGVISKLRGTAEKPSIFRHDVPTTPDTGHYWVEETRGPGASYNVAGCSRANALLSYGAKACPSIHMPRWASRIELEVSRVRVERLNRITEEDAEAEGAAPAWLDVDGETVNLCRPTYRQGFARLWRDINGDESWDANPWVWVVEFKKIERELVRRPDFLSDEDVPF